MLGLRAVAQRQKVQVFTGLRTLTTTPQSKTPVTPKPSTIASSGPAISNTPVTAAPAAKSAAVSVKSAAQQQQSRSITVAQLNKEQDGKTPLLMIMKIFS